MTRPFLSIAAFSALLLACLLSGTPALAAPPTNLTVTLDSDPHVDQPLAVWPNQSFTLVADGQYEFDGPVQQEIEDGLGEVEEQYFWESYPAVCETWPDDSANETFRYPTGTDPDFYTISVTYKVTVKYKDGSSEPAHSATDSIEVAVCRLTDLSVSGAYRVGQSSDWAASVQSGAGWVTVTAEVSPVGATSLDQVGNLIGWSGAGQPVEGNPFQVQVSRTAAGTFPVGATAGSENYSVGIIICQVSWLSVVSGATAVDDDNAVTAADKDDTAGVILLANLYPSVSPVPSQLLLWSGGSHVPDHPEQRKVLKTTPAKQYVKCACGTSSDDLTVWPVKINLSLAGVAEEDEDTVPAEVVINTDDDNTNSTADLNETDVSGENDLLTVGIQILPDGLPGGAVTLEHSGDIELWLEQNKATQAPGSWNLPDDVPQTVWLEGRAVSLQAGDESVTLSFQWSGVNLQDQGLVTVNPRYGDSEASLGVFKQHYYDAQAGEGVLQFGGHHTYFSAHSRQMTNDSFRQPLLALAVGLLTLAPGLAQTPPSSPSLPPLAQAQALLIDMKPQEALAIVAPLAVPSSPDRKQAEAARLLQTSCCTALGDTEKALAILQDLASGAGVWAEVAAGTRLGAWRGLADIYLAQGDTLAVEAALKEVVALFPQAEEARLREAAESSPAAAKILQYNLNRLALDGAPGNAMAAAQRLAGAQVKAGDYGAAPLICRRACLTYPEIVGHQRYALQVAEHLRAQAVRMPQDEAGKRRAQEVHQRALSWYLEALDTGADRCFSATALLG